MFKKYEEVRNKWDSWWLDDPMLSRAIVKIIFTSIIEAIIYTLSLLGIIAVCTQFWHKIVDK